MDRDGIKQFMREIECRNIRDEPSWVMSSCPLAPWSHDSGGDSNPSFGISVHDDDTSIFNCFTCHHKGPLVHLLELLEDYSGDSYEDLRETFGVSEEFGPPLGDWGRKSNGDREETLGEPLSIDFLDVYELPWTDADARAYLIGRGLTEQEYAESLELRYDPEERRILFPVYHDNGDFYGFTSRAIDEDNALRVKDYHGLKKKLLLLGSHNLPEGAEKVVLVEGAFDYAVTRTFGVPSVAALGTAFVQNKADALIRIAKPVYIMFDPDAPGRSAAKKYAAALIRHLPVFDIQYPKELSNFDPAELYPEEVYAMIEAAELFDV